jgi:hypothetical protein
MTHKSQKKNLDRYKEFIEKYKAERRVADKAHI